MAVGPFVAKVLASIILPKVLDKVGDKVSDTVKEKIAQKKLDDITNQEFKELLDTIGDDLTPEQRKALQQEIKEAQAKDVKNTSKSSDKDLEPALKHRMDIYKEALKKDKKDYYLQDVIAPAISKGARAGTSAFANYRNLLGQALQAVSGSLTPEKSKELYGKDLLETAATVGAAKASLEPLVATAIANTVADTIDHATQAAQADDTRAETMAYQYINPSNTGYYQYLNQLTKLSNKQ